MAREMMFGLGDEFEYLECAGCGCLQLRNPPTDLSRFYPESYYSYRPREEHRLIRFLKRIRVAHGFGHRSLLGALLVRRYGLPPDLLAVRRSGAQFDDAILDVGCGDGRLLRDLRVAGFTDLSGVDPYLRDPLPDGPGIVIWKAELREITGAFDLALLNHAFEHMPDPAASLEHLYRILEPGGRVLIRIPVADSHAWRQYGTDWVQLDAPRHLFLHTHRSISLLAERSGFRISSVEYDSTGFQFWGSEQYRRGIPLRTGKGTGERPHPGIFSRRELSRFAARAEELNRRGEGDQACFCLVKP